MVEKRVYPAGGGKRTAYVLLFVSLVLILTGLFGRADLPADSVELAPRLEPTPDLSTEAFDQTPATRELTLPERTYYTIQLGAFETEASALEAAEGYRKRGAAGYVLHDLRYRVLAALYPDRMDAQLVRVQLNETHGLDAYVYPVTLQGVTLRMNGAAGQLDALEAACAGLGTLLDDLQALSVQLDRQTLSAEEAVAALRTHGETARLLAARLDQRFTAPRHDAVERLLAALAAYAEYAAGVTAEDGSVLLATQTKYQAFCALGALKGLADTFRP